MLSPQNMTSEQKRKALLASTLLLIGGALYLLSDTQECCAGDAVIPASGEPAMMKEMLYARAKEIVDPQGFINTENDAPIKIADHIGKKVILVDFWTYSCINCIRTQPYLNAWHEKYADDGLLIIGIHTPEFDFERKIENVRGAVRDEEIQYPVVLDNNYGTWRAYQNSYWPRKYLIDMDGYIRYDHIGEGAYDETERKIQELLAERAERMGEEGSTAKDLVTPENVLSASDGLPRTPEIYFGASRNSAYLGNGTAGAVGSQTLTIPQDRARDRIYLGGTWNITSEYAETQEPGIPIVLTYRGKALYMVASSPTTARLQISIDGKVVRSGDPMAGKDIGSDDFVTVRGERLYKLIESDTYGEHTIEIQVTGGPLQAFTLTFG